MHSRFSGSGKRWEPGCHGVFADVPGQRLPAPDLGGIAQIFRFRASQMHHPCFGVLANPRRLGTMVLVLQRRHRAHRQSPRHPFGDAQAGHSKRPTDTRNRFSRVIPQEDIGSLSLAPRALARPRQPLESRLLFG